MRLADTFFLLFFTAAIHPDPVRALDSGLGHGSGRSWFSSAMVADPDHPRAKRLPLLSRGSLRMNSPCSVEPGGF